jgi:hypothetical protein
MTYVHDQNGMHVEWKEVKEVSTVIRWERILQGCHRLRPSTLHPPWTPLSMFSVFILNKIKATKFFLSNAKLYVLHRKNPNIDFYFVILSKCKRRQVYNFVHFFVNLSFSRVAQKANGCLSS